MKNYRIYYNFYLENVSRQYCPEGYETKVVMVTLEEAVEAMKLCKEHPEKYEFLSLERIPPITNTER